MDLMEKWQMFLDLVISSVWTRLPLVVAEAMCSLWFHFRLNGHRFHGGNVSARNMNCLYQKTRES